ncbi:hypothetical protein E1N52_27130 [Paraburkholderia guartelaensis]|uniref:Uncharacterized protein n=1 Tax=Paraburkholderia guartelaensis TaxID=2546446 RepID=A0A4R5L8I7_9BURK|nr:hypothetical protein [Paraburkholderia guartelaensis]TDG05111.1 hypothetical protein E1N52_27130 [Paraburkholderia guartelaensis]
MSRTIGEQQFRKCMNAAEMLSESATNQDEIDYLHGYRYGLRRCYHGKEFGSDAEIAQMLSREGAMQDGFRHGLVGIPVALSRFGD